MIGQTSFLGIPLRTQRQRRLLVGFYYALVLGFCATALSHGSRSMQLVLIPQTLTIGGLLGGIKMGGPVKNYSSQPLPLEMDSSVLTLNLAGRKQLDAVPLLDEREQLQRDHAHYVAYRILRWSLGAVVVLYFLSLNWTFAWASTRGPILAWTLLVYVLSLPQSVLLWTEPNEPMGELMAMPTCAR